MTSDTYGIEEIFNPFRVGRTIGITFSQGVALGYYIIPLSGNE